jgi:rod shape-determining protein MreD
MRRIALYSILSLLFILLQTTVVRFLSIGRIVPDILLIWVVYVAVRQGQVAGTVAGFLIGLVIDLLSGSDGMLGLAALTKTVAGFLAGFFYDENKTFQTLGGYQILIAVGVTSVLQNVIYFVIFLQGSEVGWWGAILLYGLPTSFYTVVVALLPMFAYARKYLT